MSIWTSHPSVNEINERQAHTICGQLGIKITQIGEDFIEGTMPADERTFQPHGLVHGGANVVLAETLGSLGGELSIDTNKYFCVGQEVNANHIRAVRGGLVTGRAYQLYAGRRSQVWEIKLFSHEGKLACVSRLTLAIVER